MVWRRSGAGLARMLLYGLFCNFELFYGCLSRASELAAGKALAHSLSPLPALIIAALRCYTCGEDSIRNQPAAQNAHAQRRSAPAVPAEAAR